MLQYKLNCFNGSSQKLIASLVPNIYTFLCFQTDNTHAEEYPFNRNFVKIQLLQRENIRTNFTKRDKRTSINTDATCSGWQSQRKAQWSKHETSLMLEIRLLKRAILTVH